MKIYKVYYDVDGYSGTCKCDVYASLEEAENRAAEIYEQFYGKPMTNELPIVREEEFSCFDNPKPIYRYARVHTVVFDDRVNVIELGVVRSTSKLIKEPYRAVWKHATLTFEISDNDTIENQIAIRINARYPNRTINIHTKCDDVAFEVGHHI